MKKLIIMLCGLTVAAGILNAESVTVPNNSPVPDYRTLNLKEMSFQQTDPHVDTFPYKLPVCLESLTLTYFNFGKRRSFSTLFPDWSTIRQTPMRASLLPGGLQKLKLVYCRGLNHFFDQLPASLRELHLVEGTLSNANWAVIRASNIHTLRLSHHISLDRRALLRHCNAKGEKITVIWEIGGETVVIRSEEEPVWLF